jgi:hypothetical protein
LTGVVVGWGCQPYLGARVNGVSRRHDDGWGTPARGRGRSVFQGRPRTQGVRDLTVLLVGASRGMKVIDMMMAPTGDPPGIDPVPMSRPPGQATAVVATAAVTAGRVSAGSKASSPSSPRM